MEEWVGLEIASHIDVASYHAATRTLNLPLPARLGGEELAAWVEESLRAADEEPSASSVL